MNQLDKRLTKLEKAMDERLPNLDRLSIEQLAKLLFDGSNNPARTEIILQAMSLDQHLAINNLIRVQQGLLPEAPPPGVATKAELLRYYPKLAEGCAWACDPEIQQEAAALPECEACQ